MLVMAPGHCVGFLGLRATATVMYYESAYPLWDQGSMVWKPVEVKGYIPRCIVSDREKPETDIIREDRSQSGLQLGAAYVITHCARQKVFLHAPHLKTFAPHCVFGPLGCLGAAWQLRTCGSLFPKGWRENSFQVPPRLGKRRQWHPS